MRKKKVIRASTKLTKDFCRCIKKVRSYIKPRDSQGSQGSRGSVESAAIAVCIKSVLQTKGKTLRKFSCRKGKLFTQKKKH
jgi:hypothetical protein